MTSLSKCMPMLRRNFRRIVSWILLGPMGMCCFHTPALGLEKPLLQLGAEAFEKGAFKEALEYWRDGVDVYTEQGDWEQAFQCVLNLGETYNAMGEFKVAYRFLNEAIRSADLRGDAQALLAAQSALGSACIFTRKAEEAEPLLSASLKMAKEQQNYEQVAKILNNLGILYGAQERNEEAIGSFVECAKIAESHGFFSIAAKASINAINVRILQNQLDTIEQLLLQTDRYLEKLEPGHQKAYLILNLGQLYQKISTVREFASDQELWMKRAYDAYLNAKAIGQKNKDWRTLTYANGYLGELYQSEKRYDEALILMRRAAFYASQGKSSDALYRWQWQIGRILNAQGRMQQAIDAYYNALETLKMIRHDLAIGYGNSNRKTSFREKVGPIYFEFADLLLRRTDEMEDPELIQSYLREARRSVELFKSVELEDYFQDDCISLLRKKVIDLDSLKLNTAVVYIIPLEDRIELLLTLPSGLKRVTNHIKAEVLNREIKQFRLYLEDRTTFYYKPHAKRLYDWLIRPIEDKLIEEQVETLVFVPDGLLRTIPMAALYDGEQFLIEKFALAVTPGLALMEPKPIERKEINVLLSGLSEGESGFSSLPFVPLELENIEKYYSSRKLLDEQFTYSNMVREMRAEDFNIVHIASHGQFSSKAKDTFILTKDGKLTLDGLEQLIRPAQLQGHPVELLALSACQTAEGDDRAALGLAGVAVKAGARSVLGSLWFVSDEATAVLLDQFYKELKDPRITKAEALRRAQITLLKDFRFRHPRYWAPYLIIGNWL